MNEALTLVFFGDVCLSVFAACSGALFGYDRFFASGGFVPSWRQVSIFVAVTIFSSYMAEFYAINGRASEKIICLKTFMTFIISMFGFSVLNILTHFLGIKLTVIYLAVFCVLQLLFHLGFNALLKIPKFAKKVLVVGTGPLASKIGGVFTDGAESVEVLQGYYQCSNEPVHVPSGSIVKNGDGLSAAVRREGAQKIVISVTDRRGTLPVDEIMYCKFRGIEVIDAPSFYEEATGKLLVENLRPSWFIFSEGFRITPALRFFKRCSDVFFSMLGLALCAPLIPFIIIAIKMDSKGPVLFRQTRVGEMEKQFVIYKFRTMYADAEEGTGAVWASKQDPRVTRAGRVLRSTRLDEIMQLVNVLKGDMSFVGPRPERPEFVKKLKKTIPYYSERHFVKPGITGWAQVRFRYGASVEDSLEKLRYDLYYIKNMSLFLDFYIILETVKVMLFEKGS